jgi:hypothetical protein
LNDTQHSPLLNDADAPPAPARRGDARLDALDEAIAREPDVAENYLLRGEALLDRGERGDDLAAAVDLWRAAALAEARLRHSAWGIAAQITMDRARALLEDLAGRGVRVDVR